MKPQTQQLVRLIADEVPGRLIAALRDQPQTAPRLEKATGASQKTVAHTLELLQAHGIVEWQQDEAGTPGRPSRIWRLLADKELAAFEQSCDAFKALMLRKQLDDYDRPADEARRGRG
jgi:predicted ArsR family transcriptional regulator